MEETAFVFGKIVFEGREVCVAAFEIGLGRGKPVAEHFFDEDEGHRGYVDFLSVPVEFRPVFEMMAVSSLMVKPGGGIAFILTLGYGRTAFAVGKIFYSVDKFRRRKFGNIVKKTAKRDTRLYAVKEDEFFVVKNDFQMPDELIHNKITFILAKIQMNVNDVDEIENL